MTRIMAKHESDEMDYDAEGATPPREKDDPTNAGYDEAAHRGGEYGVAEGRGGVFGTTGGGTWKGGMHIEERPAVDRGDGGRAFREKPASLFDEDQTEVRDIRSRQR